MKKDIGFNEIAVSVLFDLPKLFFSSVSFV